MSETQVFEENPRGKDQLMWKHFLRERSGNSAKCKKCSNIIKTAGGSTSGLRRHLRVIHNIACETQPPQPTAKKQCMSSIENFFPVEAARHHNTLPHVAARMVALDGLPFRVLATSKDIRAGLTAQGFADLPSSPNTFRQMVMNVHAELQKCVINEFQRMKVKFQFAYTHVMKLLNYNITILSL